MEREELKAICAEAKSPTAATLQTDCGKTILECLSILDSVCVTLTGNSFLKDFNGAEPTSLMQGLAMDRDNLLFLRDNLKNLSNLIG